MRYVLCLLLLLTAVSSQAEHSVSIVNEGSGYFFNPEIGITTEGHCLSVGEETEFHIHITNNGTPECYYNPAFAFVIHDNGSGGTWTWPSNVGTGCFVSDELLFLDTFCIPVVGCFPDSVFFDRGGTLGGYLLFENTYSELRNAYFAGPDTIGFVAESGYGRGLYEGLDVDALKIVLTPNTLGSVICIDIAPDCPTFEWGWHGVAVDSAVAPCSNDYIYPEWGGPRCYTVAPGAGCCGLYTGGFTGNANMSPDGRMSLSDITTIIDHVYISQRPLLCPPNGNTNGSVDGFVTLSDITVLIDHVYISKNPTATCQ